MNVSSLMLEAAKCPIDPADQGDMGDLCIANCIIFRNYISDFMMSDEILMRLSVEMAQTAYWVGKKRGEANGNTG